MNLNSRMINVLMCSTIVFVETIFCWSLTNLYMDRDDFRIVHVSVFYVRAFLCIDRVSRQRRHSSNSDGQSMIRNLTIRNRFPTIIETGWPENFLPIKPHVFPDHLAHAHHDKECNSIIRALGSAVDMINGDLWVLDRGSKYCDAKAISFNLIGRNEENHRYNLPNFSYSSIHTGPELATAQNRNNSRIFFTLTNHDFIVVYYPHERKWWKVKFIINDMIVIPQSLAFTPNGNLYIVDAAHHLWLSSDVIHTINSKNYNNDKLATNTGGINYFEVSVMLVNDVMGTATSLVIDPAEQLYYYMPRDKVVVRWDTRKALNAENHDVLFFASRRVIQIVFGAKGSVYVVEEQANWAQEHCHRVLSHFTGASQFSSNYIYKNIVL